VLGCRAGLRVMDRVFRLASSQNVRGSRPPNGSANRAKLGQPPTPGLAILNPGPRIERKHDVLPHGTPLAAGRPELEIAA